MADDLFEKSGKRSADQHLASRKEKEICKFKIEVSDKKKTSIFVYLLSEYRVYLFKPNGKAEHEAHLLELEDITSSSPQEISIKFKFWNLVATSKHVNEIVYNTYMAYISKLPYEPENRFTLNVTPPTRVEEIFRTAKVDVGPCGGFGDTYSAFCTQVNNPVNQDFVWDVENIWPVVGVRELNLAEFRKENLTQQDLKALMDALKHNKWFTGLKINGIKLTTEGLATVSDCLRMNCVLKTLSLHRVIGTRDGFITLANQLLDNKKVAITSIDLSNNSIEDRGAAAWATLLEKYPAPLSHLDISHCGIEKKGMTALFKALENNSTIANSLKTLNISGNILGVEGSEALSAFLGKATALTELSMANTNPNFHALKKCQSLTKLDFSGNRISNRENLHLDLVRFLRFSANLTSLNLSNTLLHPETFGDFFTEKPLCDLTELDMSDNELGDAGITALCKVLTPMVKLSKLSLGGNFLNSKTRPKSRVEAIEALSNLVMNEKSGITALHLPGNPKAALKVDVAPFLFELINNDTLKELDITGHEMGDLGTVALGKLLQVNNTLTKLYWDQNLLTFNGLKNLKIALTRNRGLKFSPLPATDIGNLLKNADATLHPAILQVTHEIEELLFSHNTEATIHTPPQSQDNDPLIKALAGSLLPKIPKAETPAPTTTTPQILELPPSSNPFSAKGFQQVKQAGGRGVGINTKSANALFGELSSFIKENPVDDDEAPPPPK